MSINLNDIKYKELGFFRHKKIKNKYLLTSDTGEYIILSEEDFKNFLLNKLDKKGDVYKSLESKNFLKNNFNLSHSIDRYNTKKNFILNGPCLHIIITTLRCNHRCVYCQTSAHDMKKKGVDMSIETAKKSLDIIFKTTSPFVAIEFQGGEPLANWPLIKYIVEESIKRSKIRNKELDLRLISNFSLMTKEKYNFLIKHKVSFCTSLDGPKRLHDKNRPINLGTRNIGSHKSVKKWINIFNKDYDKIREEGYIWRMSGIVVISRYSLDKYKEIVNEYIKFGFQSLFFRPLNPFGFSMEVWEKIAYTDNEFIEFYKKSLDYIIEINKKGTHFVEKYAKIFLEKILTKHDPNMMEIRSPCGAGIGQMAYHYNGDVYSCDEGRMISMMGDESFRLGNVFNNSYEELVSGEVVKTLCTSSCLVAIPGCSDCAYMPYCGTCPIYNYYEQGDIFGKMPTNERCKINKAILDYLFEKLQNKETKEIFEKWLIK